MSETQDLAELEMAFAKDPASPAFLALSSAYLQQGRFMEAMVVCKKGIKSQPDNVEGRLLLARVYAEQGKVPKALEEVRALLEQKPDLDGRAGASAHLFHGQMLEKSGKFEEAIEAFKEALRKDRDCADATAALKAKGVEWSPGPSPEEIAAAEAARRAEEEARLAAEAEAARAAAEAEAQRQAQAAAAARPAMQPASQPSAGRRTQPPAVAGPMSAPTPRTTSMPSFPANDPAYQGYAGAYGMFSGPVPVAAARRGPGFTFGLFALGLLLVAGFIVFLKVNKADKEAIVAHWKAATKLVQSDTTGGHKGAVKELEAALKIDDDQPNVVGQHALSLAILAVERGEKELDDAARKAAEHAMKVAEDQPTSIAAQMIVLRDQGKAAEAVPLAQKLGADETTLPISVRVALGRAYAALGKVPEMVKIAETLKDTPDASALAFVGETLRRTGAHARARQALDGVMKNNLDHDPGRALRALTILEDDDSTNLNVAIDDLRSLKELGKDAVGATQRGYASLGMAVVGRKIGRPERDNELEMTAAKSALGSDPELPFFEAKQLLAADKATAAIPLLQEAIKRDRVRVAAYVTLVEAASRAKSWAAADAALADGAAVFGDNLALGLAKGNRLAMEGRHDDAVAHLKGMLASHDVAEVYRELGRVFLRKDDVAQGVDWLKKAADKAKSRSPAVQANIYTTLGKAYAQAGDHAQAKAIFGESLNATSEYSITYWWLGLTLEKLGETAKAKDALRKYITAEPNGQYKDPALEKINSL